MIHHFTLTTLEYLMSVTGWSVSIIPLFDDNILEEFNFIIVFLDTYHSLISYNVSLLVIEVQDDDDHE